MAGFDFDVFNSLDHDLSTEEYELVEFDQPSVDELVSFINGSNGARPPPSLPLGGVRALAVKKDCHVHAPPDSATAVDTAAAPGLTADGESGSKKKKKNKKKKRRAAAVASASAAPPSASPSLRVPPAASTGAIQNVTTEHRDTAGSVGKPTKGLGGTGTGAARATERRNHGTTLTPTQPQRPERHADEMDDEVDDEDDDDEDDDDEDESEDAESSDETSSSSTLSPPRLPRDLQEKMRLARQNPSAIFCESQFEEDDEETQEQLESFRRALESAHVDSRKRAKLKPRVQFAPQDVFRSSTLAASQRQSSQFVSTAI